MKRVLRTTLALLITIVALSATPTGSPVVEAQGTRLDVVASFSILADVARQVAGDAADVRTLIPLGSNPHAYQPSARDVVTLSEANVVLVAGANFEEGLLPVVQEASAEKMTIVSACIPIRPVGMHTEEIEPHENHPAGEDDHAMYDLCEAHHATAAAAFGLDDPLEGAGTLGLLVELDCGDDHGDGGHIHAEGSCDPHVWTDPVNAGLWALMIRDTLSAQDPANAGIYAANTEAYLGELAAVVNDVQTLLSAIPEEQRFIVTNHLAFNYFANRFGLTLVGVIIPGGSTTSEPSVRDVLDLIEVIQDYNVPAIFTENIVSESLAQQIAQESGAAIVRLYTGSLSEPGGPADTYISYTRFNAASIAEALK